MAQWHLTTLHNALAAKGWRILAVIARESPGRTAASWEIQRSTLLAPLHLDIGGFDFMGNDLPLEKAFECTVRDHREINLYFRRPVTFPPDLAAFITVLDTLETDLKKAASASQPNESN